MRATMAISGPLGWVNVNLEPAEVIAQAAHNAPAYIPKTRAPYFVFRGVRRGINSPQLAGTRMSITRART